MEKVAISKNRFFFWAVIIAAFNPILSGMILGLFMMSQPELKKEGRIVTLFSAVWGLIVLALVAKFRGALPV